MTWTSFPLFSPFRLELFLILSVLDLFSIFLKGNGREVLIQNNQCGGIKYEQTDKQ